LRSIARGISGGVFNDVYGERLSSPYCGDGGGGADPAGWQDDGQKVAAFNYHITDRDQEMEQMFQY
jgi:hypothetical protein